MLVAYMSDLPEQPHANRPDSQPEPRRRSLAIVGVLVTALLVAIVSAIGTGLGSDALDKLHGDDPAVSYSADEQLNECGTSLFVAGDRATSGTVASAQGWQAFQRSNNAVLDGAGVVEVSIQGESSRTITLTGISFTVERRPRPAGATFTNPCGGSIIGRQVVADLDRRPVAVIRSSEAPDGIAGGSDGEGRRVKPIRFPWTVSITDPLLLQIVATTKRCYCVWRAEIPWRSGGKSGVIQINNKGRGYVVVGNAGGNHFGRDRSSPSGWTRVK